MDSIPFSALELSWESIHHPPPTSRSQSFWPLPTAHLFYHFVTYLAGLHLIFALS